MPPETTTRQITAVLDRIEKEHAVAIVLACESGSRAWGFASPDSDFDVRFIYVHPTEWYLSVGRQRDVIETPPGKILDVNGWDLRKSLQLMRRSNPPLYEWLVSPIRYRAADKLLAPLLALADRAFLPESACHHYLAMARHQWRRIRSDNPVRVKTYLYALRTVLCCRWIVAHQSPPPMRIAELIEGLVTDPELIDAVRGLIRMKSRGTETVGTERLPKLDSFLLQALERLSQTIPKNPPRPPLSDFDATFREILLRLPPTLGASG